MLIGSAADALGRWLPRGSLDAIYVNHPEPPQQAAAPGAADAADAGAEAAPEAAHMLDAPTLAAAAAALRPGGTLTVVTDNAWYAELLLGLLSSHGGFGPPPDSHPPRDATLVTSAAGAAGAIHVYAAAPGRWCRHEAEGASSYFDRMWRTGLSLHSSAEQRYVLHVAAARPVAHPEGGLPHARPLEGRAAGGGATLANAAAPPARKGKKRRRADTV